MKRFYLYIIAALLLFGGCIDNVGDDTISGGEDTTTLTISLEQSRTSLGGKSGDTYPVYWSEGDKIAINGVCSAKAEIDASNKACAKFSVSTSLHSPYYITYPYTSATSADFPKVLFPAEQSYAKGSFASDSAPMCGYATNLGKTVVLSHLAGVLRLPIKAEKEGIQLEKVIVTSTSGKPLAGIFNVDCSTASISPNKGCISSITYSLPDNFVLHTTTAEPLHIALPAGEAGNCKIELIEPSGKKMVCIWRPTTPVKRGVVREFDTITYKAGTESAIAPFVGVEESLIIRYNSIFGYVKDSSGNPIKDVPVSDGFTIVTTDERGYYSIDISKDTYYIYITIPSEYEVPIGENGEACFFKKYPSDTQQYDFTLTPLAGGKEKKFALFTFGDPQVSNDASVARFYNEAVPGIKTHCDEVSQKMPCYGITLGDIISNGTSSNRGHLRIPMRDGFSVSQVGMPVFHVMGNHDCTFYNSTRPIFPDEYNSSYNLVAQREHEEVFGPVNYSFNRGDVHIIGMRNIIYTSNTAQSVKLGFLDSQLEWLKQDLALVPKDHTVLFCVHIPMMKDNTLYNTPAVLELLNTFPKMHIISGHRHFVWNYEYAKEGSPYTNLEEHVMGAICGAWWKTNLCGDGAPCGYGVFVGEGKELSDWYHIGYHEGMNERSHQMRLYRGNAITGAAKPAGDSSATKGYYAFNFSEDTLLANIYFADSGWTVTVYEDGVYSGNMTKVPYVRRPTLADFTGDGSWESPYMPKIATSNDTYVTGLMLGLLGLSDSTGGARDECYHMYQYKLKNKDAKIKVEAIDRWGNIYTETKITEGTDYSITKAK